jgi:hypothetical protein
MKNPTASRPLCVNRSDSGAFGKGPGIQCRISVPSIDLEQNWCGGFAEIKIVFVILAAAARPQGRRPGP